MTIEEFEKKVLDIFIEKGWGKEHDNSGLLQCSWFQIEIKSLHKIKYVTIYRQVNNCYILDVNSADYEELFENAIEQLKEMK